MNKALLRTVSALSITSLLAVGLSGCTNSNGDILGETDMTLADVKQVKDFYTEELKGIDLLEEHTRTVEDAVEFMEMSEEDKSELLGKTMALIPMLNSNAYIADEYLKMQMHDNVKSVLQDKVLTGGNLIQAKRTRDMYLLDMEFDLSMRNVRGSMKGDAKYLGLNGAYRLSSDGTFYYLDNNFITQVNTRYVAAAEAERKAISQGLVGNKRTSSFDSATSYIDTQTENYAKFNNVLGATLSAASMMPPIDYIYNLPGAEGDISGYGIRTSCETGLHEFGFNRASLTGKATLRFIFREDSATGIKNLDNVYVWEYHMDNGIPTFEEKDVFPDFAETAVNVAVERADRVICNSDITGMSNGNIFGNKTFAIDYGNKTLSTKQLKYSSKIIDELKRKGRLWIVKVDTKQTEEVKYASKGPATFSEVRYIVLEQYGDTFVIVDELSTERKTVDEPAINYGDTSTRRFNSLYNSGNISDNSKSAIRSLMSNFYGYCQDKKWQSIADTICSDTKLVSRSAKNEMYYAIREYIIKAGDKELKYSGAITDWLGGSSDPQVEFKTLELEELPNGECIELTRYYLVSVFNDEWVINDMKELSKQELNSSEDVERVRQQIEGYKASTK